MKTKSFGKHAENPFDCASLRERVIPKKKKSSCLLGVEEVESGREGESLLTRRRIGKVRYLFYYSLFDRTRGWDFKG